MVNHREKRLPFILQKEKRFNVFIENERIGVGVSFNEVLFSRFPNDCDFSQFCRFRKALFQLLLQRMAMEEKYLAAPNVIGVIVGR